ncbi:MAG: muconolactone Delta-isomerase family protein [Pseudomonadota bacterium]|nr:muconolactone Delta-isomerase family protein [Pseudomonadota bacterium]
MLMLFITDVVKPDGMSNDEFIKIWNDEAVTATAALKEGAIKHLWKAAGQYQVIGVFDLPDGDAMDAALHALPIWQQGHHEMAQNTRWIPLRPYENWAADLKEMSSK